MRFKGRRGLNEFKRKGEGKNPRQLVKPQSPSLVFHHSRTKFDILITSAIKTILAGVVSTSDVKTLRIDLDPTSQFVGLSKPHSLGVRLLGLILISVILWSISDRDSFPSSHCGSSSRCFPSLTV